MDEITAPFGKNDKRQSENEKIFELTTASSAYFFIHILPLLVLSKVGCVRWGGDNILHDENQDGKIAKGLMLPTEGIGFSNYNSIGIGNKPNFEKASFELNKNTAKSVKVIYF